MSKLSGENWWHANEARFPNSRMIDDLEPDFRSRVTNFISSLEQAGASVSVMSTRRSASRAYLMHFSWRLARGEIAAADVPKLAEVDIEWNHGDPAASRAAADEMVRLFEMVYVASLSSNHIRGTAIDLTIGWNDVLVLNNPGKTPARIESLPRSGENSDLHRIAAEWFGVRKLVSDPPHWSHDGR